MEITRGVIKTAYKVVVYGPEGIGKTTFASQFPSPVFIDTEGSTTHMDVARTPKPQSWTALMEQVRYFRDNPYIYKTLVLDTADWAETLCIRELLAKHQMAGLESFGYGKGYTYLAEEWGHLLDLLQEVVSSGMNVVVTAHAAQRTVTLPEESGSYDHWELKLQKKTAPLLKEWADMLFFANYKTIVVTINNKNKAQGGKRVMYTTHTPYWDAKNRFGLKDELAFNYSEIAGVIENGKQAENPQTMLNHATAPREPAETAKTTESNDGYTDLGKAAPSTVRPKGIPDSLWQLMNDNNVTEAEIQRAVAAKGYYPANTPIANYDANFIGGVLVGAWAQVFKMITDDPEYIPFKYEEDK